MWRASRTVPGATLGPVMMAAVSLLTLPMAAAQDPEPNLIGEEAAVAALEFDPWTVTEQELVNARRPIDLNLTNQQAGLSAAESRLEVAEDALDDAIEARKEAEQELAALEQLLQAYAIGTFVSSDPVFDPHPDAQVEATRRAAPINTITEDVVGEVQRARLEREQSVDNEAEARDARATLDDELQDRAEALVRAQQLVEDYELIVEERTAEIVRRTEEAVTLNERPILGEARGIRVNVGLVGPLEALLAAAEQDGIVLSGWGHRPVEQQIVLRLSHCGDSGYAIFDMPSSSCRPPTARPGHSEHELGLAIDFTENGAILNSSTPGFAWLVDNAADYGLFNLPSEPWHWSTTGH